MEKKIYEPPQLQRLGSVQELTAGTSPPTNCSAFESDFGTEDAICEIPT
jgi:hypothetical protein